MTQPATEPTPVDPGHDPGVDPPPDEETAGDSESTEGEVGGSPLQEALDRTDMVDEQEVSELDEPSGGDGGK